MPSPNEITSILAIFMLALVSYGTRRAIADGSASALDWFMRGIFIISTVIMLRLLTWDVIVAGIDAYYPGAQHVTRAIGNWFNAVWNLLLAYACWCALKGLHGFIPEHERGQYNPITAAFYPRDLFYWRRRK